MPDLFIYFICGIGDWNFVGCPIRLSYVGHVCLGHNYWYSWFHYQMIFIFLGTTKMQIMQLEVGSHSCIHCLYNFENNLYAAAGAIVIDKQERSCCWFGYERGLGIRELMLIKLMLAWGLEIRHIHGWIWDRWWITDRDKSFAVGVFRGWIIGVPWTSSVLAGKNIINFKLQLKYTISRCLKFRPNHWIFSDYQSITNVLPIQNQNQF